LIVADVGNQKEFRTHKERNYVDLFYEYLLQVLVNPRTRRWIQCDPPISQIHIDQGIIHPLIVEAPWVAGARNLAALEIVEIGVSVGPKK